MVNLENLDVISMSFKGFMIRQVLQPSRLIKVYLLAFFGFLIFYTLFFSPTVFSGTSFNSGDTLLYHYPAVLRPWSIWSDDLMSGYPMFADSQAMTWYPLRHIGLGFHFFVVSAYVLASFFTFGFVLELTRSCFSAIISAFIYGLGGFMMAHLGHTAIIHAAAWIPLVLWSLLQLSGRLSLLWIGVGATGVCCSFLGGHPQIFVNGMCLVGVYAAFQIIVALEHGRKFAIRLGLAYLLLLVLGIGLSAIQLLPSLEVIPLSQRSEMTFGDFASYELLLKQWPIIVFPNILGSFRQPWPHYFGPGAGLVEVSCYFGLSALLLISLAWLGSYKRREVIFWSVIAILAFLYGLGDQTPLGSIAYHAPVLNKFRAPARMLMVSTLCIAVLAGVGARQIAARLLTTSRVLFACALSGLILIGLCLGVAISYPEIASLASMSSVSLPGMMHNPAVYGPISYFLIMATLIAFSVSKPGIAAEFLMVCLLLVDLGSFNCFLYWRMGGAQIPTLDEPIWKQIRSDTRLEGRITPLEGIYTAISPATPNLNTLFGIPSTTGYGPLSLKRYVEATGMTPYASIDLRQNPGLAALLDVKWMIASTTANLNDPPLNLGSTCGSNTRGPLYARIPQDFHATKLEIISSLGCSQNTGDNEAVIGIDVTGGGAIHQSIDLLAGRDTSEWSIDNPGLYGIMKHRRAPIFRSFQAVNYKAHQYIASLSIGSGDTSIGVDGLTLTLKPAAPVINITSISLVNDTNGARYTIPLWRFTKGDEKWDSDTVIANGDDVLHLKPGNQAAAWLVNSWRTDTPDAIVTAIRTGHFSDGTSFDAKITALFDETTPNFPDKASLGHGSVMVREHASGLWTMLVDAASPGFMVLSQVDYPGWSAEVNGRPTPIFITDHAFQGVVVPKGESQIVFKFSPLSLKYGISITALSLTIILVLIVIGLWSKSDRVDLWDHKDIGNS